MGTVTPLFLVMPIIDPIRLQENLHQAYPSLFEQELVEEMAAVAYLKTVAAGDYLIHYGEQLRYMPLVLDGILKILRQDSEGEELLLYFIGRGNTCAMTLSCCMGNSRSKIAAVAETKGTLVLLPLAQMEQWMAAYASWRAFVLNSYHERFEELLEAVDNLAFLKMDERLYNYLREKARLLRKTSVLATHQQIADDLHSSRVVISRLLKSLEHRGRVKLHRNRVELLDLHSAP